MFKIKQVLDELKIKNYKFVGSKDVIFRKASSLSNAKSGDITFCSALSTLGTPNNKFRNPEKTILESQASVIIAPDGMDFKDINQSRAIILVRNPKEIFCELINFCFVPSISEGMVDKSAAIDKESIIDSSAIIGPNSVIGKCTVGKNVIIGANTVLEDGVIIGDNCTIESNTVIGSQGFGFYKKEGGDFGRFPHIGRVEIGDNVEIGSNSCIDRGSLGNTIIEDGVKIDNHVHVAHNCHVKKKAILTAKVLLGGSVKIGEEAWLGPSSSIRDGLSVGDKALVGIGSVVVKNVKQGITVMGVPAKEKK